MNKIDLLRGAAIAAAVGAVPVVQASVSAVDSTAITLRSVEVTANRATAKTPVAYTNMAARQIKEVNDGRDLPFIIQQTPSVVVTGDAGGGIGYSGIRVRGTDPTRINVTANGVPINDSESSRTYWVNMPDIASSLRDVQIQRGAGTSANGAGAFGASINMITDAPGVEPSAEATLSYGSYNSNRQTVKVGTGAFADSWSADLRLSHIGSDGYIERASSQLWSYMGQLAWMGHGSSVRLLAFGGKERTYMAWEYASREDMKKYGRRYNPCGQYTDSAGQIAYYPDQYDNFAQHHLQLIGAHTFNDHLRMNVSLHYTKGDGYYEQYKTRRTLTDYGLKPFVDSVGNTVKKSDLIRRKFNDNDFGGGVFTLNGSWGRVNAVLGGGANWFMGRHFGQVMWVRNYVGPINPLQEYYRNNGRKFDSNVYGRGDYSLSEHLSSYVDLQLRHIRYSVRGLGDYYDWTQQGPVKFNIRESYTFFNPKAGISYTDRNQRAYVSWSVAHKEPVRDNFTDADPGQYPRPERLFDYEAGWSYAEKAWNVGMGLYYMDYRDQLVLSGKLSDTGNPLSVNVPESYRVGMELQGSWRPTAWFDWQANATLSRSRIKNFVEYVYEDEWTNPITIDCGTTPIAFSPDVVANNSFNFRHGGWSGSLSTRYVSSQYLNNAASAEAKLDAYCVSDLSAGYTWRNIRGIESLRLGATVYNLFNAKYCNNGNSGAGYTVNAEGKPEIYRYAGFAAQAPVNFMTTLSVVM